MFIFSLLMETYCRFQLSPLSILYSIHNNIKRIQEIKRAYVSFLIAVLNIHLDKYRKKGSVKGYQ